MSVVVICSYIVAAALALSRILGATKPYWSFLPSKVAAIVPSVVAMLPVLADKVGVAKTGVDLVQALIVAGALLLPGAGVQAATPIDPPQPS